MPVSGHAAAKLHLGLAAFGGGSEQRRVVQ